MKLQRRGNWCHESIQLLLLLGYVLHNLIAQGREINGKKVLFELFVVFVLALQVALCGMTDESKGTLFLFLLL